MPFEISRGISDIIERSVLRKELVKGSREKKMNAVESYI